MVSRNEKGGDCSPPLRPANSMQLLVDVVLALFEGLEHQADAAL